MDNSKKSMWITCLSKEKGSEKEKFIYINKKNSKKRKKRA